MARDLAAIAKQLLRLQKVIAAAKKSGKVTMVKSKNPARPKPVKASPGMTARDLIGSTDPSRIENAVRDRVTLVGFKQGTGANRNKILSKTLTYDNTGRRLVIRPHEQSIEKKIEQPGDDKQSFSNSKLIVQCSCEDHCFVWEYALNHHGAAKIRSSNGEFPVFKNARLAPGVCKHVWLVLKHIVRKKL
jgi:hypothetical protein